MGLCRLRGLVIRRLDWTADREDEDQAVGRSFCCILWLIDGMVGILEGWEGGK